MMLYRYRYNYRLHFNKFDKQLIPIIYKNVCAEINMEDSAYYDKDDIMGEYHLGKLVGWYHPAKDKINIDALIATRNPGQGFYNVDLFHMNIRTIEPMYYNRNQPHRHSMEYYVKVKDMKIKLGLRRINHFKGIKDDSFFIEW